MAAPNVVNVSSIIGKTQGGALATTLGDWVTCLTDKLVKVNSIIVANVDGSNASTITCSFYDHSDTARYKLAHSVDVPAKSTLVVIGKDSPIYLEEGDQIEANAGHASRLTIVISYEELDDA
jgi:hypothetical protein